MWKQLTQKARKAIFLAQEEAGRLGYSHVGPEHLLLALAREEDCVASKILEGLGLDPGTLRVEVMQRLERGHEPLGDEMQLTSEAKAAIDMAFIEAQQTNDGWVGTEHLLIGLSSQAKTIASEVLCKLGASVNRIRDQLRELQAGTLPFEHVNPSSPGSVTIL